MRILVSFLFKNSRTIALFAILSGFATGLCNTLAIALINRGIAQQSHFERKLVWAFAGICIVLPLTRVLSAVLLTQLAQKVVFDLRMKLAQRILGVPLRRLEAKGPGKLLSVLTEDINVISMAMTSIPTACMSLAIVLSGFAYMIYLYWPAGLVAVMVVVLGVSIFSFVSGKAHVYLTAARHEQDHLFAHFNGLIHGIKELKIHQLRRKYFMSEMLGITSDKFRVNRVLGAAWYAGAASMGQLMLFAAVGVLVFVLPQYSSAVTASALSGFALTLMYMILPLETLSGLVPAMAMAKISLKKVEDLGVDIDKETETATDDAHPKADWRTLTYRGIMHSYYREQENEVFTMGPLSLEFVPGELVYLIGGNGSGKTTLAKLLMGLYIPEQGEILLDDSPVNQGNLDHFRQQFSAVFSDFYLFQDMMGLCPPEKSELAKDFLERLQLTHKVQINAGHLSSVSLSQGQRKRLALLSAFLEDRPIYLFDEWAADQDPHFKDIFYRVILPNLKAQGKTVIAISHDDRYFGLADRIIKLDYGQIVLDTREVAAIAKQFSVN